MSDEVPKGWMKTTLSEVCEIIQGQSPPGYSYNTDGEGMPFFQGKAEFGALYPTPVKWCTSPTKIAQRDDVLVSIRAPVGPTNLCPSEACIGRGLAAVRPMGGIPARYILYAIRNNIEALIANATGTTFEAVSGKNLRAHGISVAPLAEQERIVAKLNVLISRVAAGETAARRALDRLSRYRAAILHSAMTGEFTRGWRKTHSPERTGAQLLKRLLQERRSRWEESELKRFQTAGKLPKGEKWKQGYKDPQSLKIDGLPQLPREWKWASLEMIAELGSGISVSESRVVKNPVTVPYLRVANVLRGRLDLSDLKKIRVNRDQLRSFLLESGDILFNEGGDRDKLGRGWIWEGQIPKCVHQNHVFRARLVNHSIIDAKLISYWGNTFGQRFFMRHGTQTTNLASINRSVLARLPVPIIPVEEQRIIGRELNHRLAAADRLAATLKRQLERAQATRRSLLSEAFAGKLVRQDSKDEPVATLLNRIRAAREAEARKPKAKRMPKPKSKIKGVETLEQFEMLVQKLGRGASPERLLIASGLGDDVEKFFDLLRAGRNKGSLVVPVGKGTIIKRVSNAN